MSPRTLTDHLNGTHPITPVEASKLLAFFDGDRSSFWLPATREALVVLAARFGSVSSADVPFHAVTVDTLHLTLNPPEAVREDLLQLMTTKMLDVTDRPGIRKHGYQRVFTLIHGSNGFMVRAGAWGHKSWMKVELSPWQIRHAAALNHILDAVGRMDDPIKVARVDIAMDYKVDVRCLILTRRRAQVYSTTSDGKGLTYSAGSRGGDLYIRLYDKAAKMRKSGPITRLEAEIEFKKRVSLGDLENALRKRKVFDKFAVTPCASDLNSLQQAVLRHAREIGFAYALKDPHIGHHLKDALKLVEQTRRLPTLADFPTSEWSSADWVTYLCEQLKLQLRPRDARFYRSSGMRARRPAKGPKSATFRSQLLLP